MTRIEFMVALEKALEGFPRETADETLAYYSEILSDRMEEGADEAEAVASVGTVDEIRDSILSEMPVRKLVRETIKPRKHFSTAAILLLILSLPVTLPLAVSLFAVILSAFIAFWAVIISLWAAEAALIAGGIGGIGLAVAELIRGNPFQALFAFGAGLVCPALAVFMFFVFKALTRALIAAGKAVLKGVKRIFIRRNAK
ncbi:MAG: DUF1700 domain-containing protein [Clostridia bacterium]|nr:DUF1700 domain-containing protein [Clostridia bacterium]